MLDGAEAHKLCTAMDESYWHAVRARPILIYSYLSKETVSIEISTTFHNNAKQREMPKKKIQKMKQTHSQFETRVILMLMNCYVVISLKMMISNNLW